jgi:hypothetical protein
MAGGFENLPPGVTQEALAQACSILDPASVAALEQLSEAPGATFSLIRPLIDPSQGSLQPVQEDIEGILKDADGFPTWSSVGVTREECLGATYFDGERQTYVDPTVFRGLSSFALAVSVCATLPVSAAEPTEAAVVRVGGSPPKSTRVIYSVALASEVLLSEAAWVDYTASTALYRQYSEPTRVHARLAYVRKVKTNTYLPSVVVTRTIEDVVQQDDQVQLDRVRLLVHPAGSSPYKRLK